MKLCLLALVTTPFVSAIDIALESFDCDVELPIYATSMDMSCDDEKRCSFGETVTFSGILEYNNTGAAGVSEDGKVYSKAGLQLMTLEYDLLDNFPFYMCGPWVAELEENDEVAYESSWGNRQLADVENDDAAQADDAVQNWNGCTVDGSYAFFVDYDLPTSTDKTSWLATGWKGVGNVRLFANSGDSESLIGYCTLKFGTYITPDEEQPMYFLFLPNSQIASYILAGFIVFCLLMIFYCTCCRCGGKKQKSRGYDSEMEKYRREEKVAEESAANPRTTSKQPQMDQFDPIENSRTNSNLDGDYQAMNEGALA
mmetsp:Transcript_28041/g.41413  ORF Transcript_28041/g.41413 Transcript_28041/m.41413 type:complete len:313 (-) Transcript_28041:59-997(-)